MAFDWLIVIVFVAVIIGLLGVAAWFKGEKEVGGGISGLGNNKIPVRNMKCTNCGAEVHEGDKFCGECGKALRREIEIEMAPIWKWGSMIASLVLIFMFWMVVAEAVVPWEAILLIFCFPATIYLMYKERREKIKYGLAWIFYPFLIFLFGLDARGPDIIFGFLFLVIPAIAIDVIYVYKTR